MPEPMQYGMGRVMFFVLQRLCLNSGLWGEGSAVWKHTRLAGPSAHDPCCRCWCCCPALPPQASTSSTRS